MSATVGFGGQPAQVHDQFLHRGRQRLLAAGDDAVVVQRLADHAFEDPRTAPPPEDDA